MQRKFISLGVLILLHNQWASASCVIGDPSTCYNRGICNPTATACICTQLELQAEPSNVLVDVFSSSDNCKSIIHPCFFEVAPIGPVDQQKCNGRGFCIPAPIGSTPAYNCECKLPFLGVDCIDKDPCYIAGGQGQWISKNCNNHGTCKPDPSNPVLSICECDNGYFGPECEFSNLCLIDDTGSPRPPEKPCNFGSCRNESSKISGIVTNKFICTCNPGKAGEYCDFDHPCVVKPCQNGGTCKISQPDPTKPPDRTCICPEGYLGNDCEQRNPCYFNSSYCKNAARCVRVDDNNMKCICTKPYFEGVQCEIVDLCKVPDESKCDPFLGRERLCNPCKNGGICTSNKINTSAIQYSCDCSATGYNGLFCEVRVEEVIIIPKDIGIAPGLPHVPRFEATSGFQHTYYILLLSAGSNVEVEVDTGDGFTFTIISDLFKPIIDSSIFVPIPVIIPPEAVLYPFSHIYSEGTYKLKAKMVNAGVASVTKVTYVTAKLPPGFTCMPNTRLIDASHSRKTATEYQRTNRLVIEAILKFDCYEDSWLDPASNPGVELRFAWKLYRLSRLFPVPSGENNWHVEKLISTSQKFLIFPSHFLLEGFYWIECRAYVKINETEYGNAQVGFFKINLSPPRLILKEGTERTIDGERETILDASRSIDDSYPEHNQYLKYTWTCYPACEQGPWKGAIVKIPGGTFRFGQVVKIHLHIRSAHSRRTSSTTIKLTVANKAQISVSCVRNCDKFNPGGETVFQCLYKVNGMLGQPSDITLVVRAEVRGQPKTRISTTSADTHTTRWLLPGEVNPTFNVADEPYMTGILLPEVNDFTPRSIVCNAIPPGLPPISAQMNLQLNVPPRGDSCEIDPPTGVYLITEFTITCTPFIEDKHYPLRYSFYVVTRGTLSEKLGDKFLFGHDTNPEAKEVYLPFGDPADGGKLNVTIVISDDLGLSKKLEIPVTVTLPPASQFVTLFEDLIFGEYSVMKRRILSGNTQGALHLQMVSAYGVFDPIIGSSLSTSELEMLLSSIENSLVEIPLHSFKATEQVMNSMHFIDRIENRADPEVLTEVSRVLFRSTAKLFEFTVHEDEVTAQQDINILTNAASDSAWRILRAANALGGRIVSAQPNYAALNQRDVHSYNNADNSDRDYFFDIHETQDAFLQEGFDGVADGAPTNVKQYSKVAHHAMFTFEQIMNTAVEQLGYTNQFLTATDDVSLHSEIFTELISDKSISMQTANPGSKVDFLFPKELHDIIRHKVDADVELQITEVEHNPFYDDSSANPHTPIINVVLKDSKSHVPVSLRKLPVALSIVLPRSAPAQAELDAGQTYHNVDILPVDEIDDTVEFTVFKLTLPYNAKVSIEILSKTSPTMIFKMLAMKGRKPTLRDICDNPTLETSPGGYTAEFNTEVLDINAIISTEAYLEYYVAVLVLDPNNPYTRQTFSIVFSRASCLHRDEDKKFWSEEGCTVETNSTSDAELHCKCNHASILSGVQFLAPHKIELVKLVEISLEEFEHNPVVLITVCVVLVVYIVGLIICHMYDKRDKTKDVGVTIMADLKATPTSGLYLITVATGCNFWAGTTSTVSMILYGKNGRSHVFTLNDRSINTFLRGSVDTFVISCDKDLGKLEKIRIWSDFSGHDPKWFCRKFLIRNVETEESWYFYIRQWMTVSADHSSVILEIPATTEEEQEMFSNRFNDNLMEQFDNVNLWFSIFRYSPASTFTRCQRITCAFGTLCSYLLIDIWLHGTPTVDESGLIEFEEFTIDVYSIIKSIQIVLLALPFGIIIVILFRNILPRYMPTVIIWSDVVTASAPFAFRNVFIPKLEVEIEKQKKQGIESDEESSKGHHKHDNISAASSMSNFYIPSTDITKLEGWIEDRTKDNRHKKHNGEGAESDSDEFKNRFVNSLDAVEDENHEVDNVFRLGRRAIVHAVRDYDPDSFIFQGENDITAVEGLIDRQIEQKKKIGKNTKDSQSLSQGNDATANPSTAVFKKVGKTPWKEAVTEEYLEDLDKILDEELEKKHKMQDKENWKARVALEICSLPRTSRPCLTWPWWFVFIAWVFSITVILGTSALTILFGIHYGYLRSLRWLESFVNAFLVSVIVVQPITACIVALLSTILGKRQRINERIQIIQRNSSEVSFFDERLPYSFTVFEPLVRHQPLKGNEIFRLTIEARRKRELQGKLFRLILCILLIFPLIAISYSGHSSNNYFITKNVRNMFQLQELGDGKVDMRSEQMVYDYIENVVLPNLHPVKMYNGRTIRRSGPALLSDQQTLLIGVGRIRQQRVKSVPCIKEDAQIIGPYAKCHKPFSTKTQDRANYDMLWGDPATLMRQPSSVTNDGWQFHDSTSRKIISLPFTGLMGAYDGGGYILELGRTKRESESVLKYMKRTHWLDHRTRAIFIELTLMNPNINKFIDVVLLIEQGPTWAFHLTSRISPIELLPLEDIEKSDEIVWVSVSTVIIVLTLACSMYLFVHDLFTATPPRLVRLGRTRILLDLVIIIFVSISLIVSVKRFLSAKEFTETINAQKTDEYVSIQKAAYWNDFQREMFSLTQALVFIKVWKLLMFTDKRFLTFALTLKLTSGFLFGFLGTLTIFLCAFASSGYFLFGQSLWEFSTWGESMTSLIDQILGVSLFNDFDHENQLMGPIYCFLFGFIIVFIGFNFVVALLHLGVHEAKEVVVQRKTWLTYSRYFVTLITRSFPSLIHERKHKNQEALETFSTLPPNRLYGMKTLTASYLRNYVKSTSYKMNEMRNHCNRLLAGAGYTMAKKNRKATQKEIDKQAHIEQLRQITSAYIKSKLGYEMKAEEFKEYAKFNSIIVKLRVQKMHKKLQELSDAIDGLVDKMH